MKAKDFFGLFEDMKNNGVRAIIKVTDHIDDSYLQEGMMGEVIDIVDKTDFYEIYIDIESFESHNDKFDKKIWYDRNGWPCLTGKEAGFYPKDHVVVIYVGLDQDIPFKVSNYTDFLAKLFDLYMKDGRTSTYNEWLEAIIKGLTNGDINIIKEKIINKDTPEWL
jgi:hypothetical protein